MRLPRIFRGKKSRKFPVQYDDRGQSLRTRCFQLFSEGERPVEVAKELEMKEATAKRYFQQWKKLGPDFERMYIFTKGLFKRTAPDRDSNLSLFAKAYGIPKEELETLLSRPHGLRRLLTGKFYFSAHAGADHKLHIVLEVALFFSDYLTKNGGKIADVCYAFERWMKENQKFREAEDADIEDENKEIAFTRQVLEAAATVEQEGRLKRDKLTEEEKRDAIRYGLEAKIESTIRNLEKQYLFRIGELKGEGLSEVQARDKIYNDLLDKGDVEGAKMMRGYQDKVHPLKADDQKPPLSPSQAPSPE